MYSHLFKAHAQILKAMAHPRRLEIIHLIRNQELFVSEIFAMLDLPQANVSQHLMILRQTGIVVAHKAGKQVKYGLAHPNILVASNQIRQFLLGQTKNQSLKKYLAQDIENLMPVFTDPVCKMHLSHKTAAFVFKYQDHDYYFCASGCLKRFKQKPQNYVKTTERKPD